MSLTGLGEIADLVKTAVTTFFPNKTEEEKAQLAAALTLVQGQLDTNKAEALSPSVFVAGWRPFVGWTCGTGFGVQFVIGPLAEWLSTLFGHPVKFPPMDLGTMMPLLLGMLGLGGMRSYDKKNGVDSGH